jgi:hypothetical protein
MLTLAEIATASIINEAYDEEEQVTDKVDDH